jgi:hypothetical protein
MNFLRFLMLLSLAVWIGALIFLPIVAQISFSALPTPHLAGLVVRNSLIALHWIGICGGLAFLVCSLLENRLARGRLFLFSPAHIIVVLMLALTAVSQFSVIPQMDSLQASAGEVASLPDTSPLRQKFDFLHRSSTLIEEAVLLLSLIVLYLTSRRPVSPPA